MRTSKWALVLAGVALVSTGCERCSVCDKNAPCVASGHEPGTPGDFQEHIKDRVFFSFDNSTITPAAAKVLELQAAWLKTYGQRKATLMGHTDARGTADYNMALSIRRSESTKKALAEMGVDRARLHARGFGKDQPILPFAKTEAEHAQNRVVVTQITE